MFLYLYFYAFKSFKGLSYDEAKSSAMWEKNDGVDEYKIDIYELLDTQNGFISTLSQPELAELDLKNFQKATTIKEKVQYLWQLKKYFLKWFE